LGGSFNPAHGGHRRISRFVIDALALEEVWWLVSPGNPLKPKAGMAPLPARLASAQRQARGSRIRASAMEREFGTRYTVETLAAILRRWPKRRFVWLMGSDTCPVSPMERLATYRANGAGLLSLVRAMRGCYGEFPPWPGSAVTGGLRPAFTRLRMERACAGALAFRSRSAFGYRHLPRRPILGQPHVNRFATVSPTGG
jgi:nicotinate-nucleotide adenylyltransferase